MELGALVCKPKNPNCSSCPVQQHCFAYLHQKTDELPYKSPAKPIPHHHIGIGIIWKNGKILVAQRREDQMLGGLWEFPGGKQEKVAKGQQVQVELLGAATGSEVSFTPVMVVDGENVLATPAQLAKASVKGKVLGEVVGKKIDGFIYKRRTNQRRRFGHRQRYSLVEITSIVKG